MHVVQFERQRVLIILLLLVWVYHLYNKKIRFRKWSICLNKLIFTMSRKEATENLENL